LKRSVTKLRFTFLLDIDAFGEIQNEPFGALKP